MTASGTRSVLILLGLVFSVARGPEARAEARASEPISPEARAAIQQIYEAHRAERRHSEPMAELGRTIREVRLRLRELAAGAPTNGAVKEVELLEAATERASSLLGSIRADAGGGSEDEATLERIQLRLDELASRTAAVVQAGTDAERALRARDLVRDLEASFPRDERTDPGPRRQPAWTFVPSTDAAESAE